MATYKLIQDIEAEDKILGPLTLRQFIFALITAFFLYICFICVAKGVPFLLVLFLPPALLAGFFAFPFSRDQPTEIWALGKLRFWFKPRRRIWDQSGIKELVSITVPKKIQHVYTDGLSQNEVQSRLKALANTIDSRGWVVKDVVLNNPVYGPLAGGNSDRLLDISEAPIEVPDSPILASDDILDEQNNPIARQFDDMIGQASRARRQLLVDNMQSATPSPVAAAPTAQWFMPAGSATPDDTAAVQTRAQKSSKPSAYSNLRTLRPGSGRAASSKARVRPVATPPPAVTTPADPAIMALANNDDLNVATLAREAQKAKGQAEVIISLH